VLQTESREWLRTIETNLFGAYLMVKHVGPLMEGPPRPRIINFAGGGAFSPFEHYSAYAVSKTALVRLTEILAIELASRDIAVNAVAPGFVATEIHEATLREGPARAGQAFFERTVHMLRHGAVPMEVPIACVKFLLSDQAAPLTGKTISASFDPWGAAAFVELIPRLNASDVYTLRRINPVNVPEASLREALATAGQRQLITPMER
jgi:NAD(P)-dependent dehydrogenase (short-subunit alcohol dehydrogenase family)